ncbi:MAG TPA: phosphopantetheine-binding protein [Caldisericia bacterium]|nr:phosphopantetheine-binding protein [Caldisericia bacterium]HOL82992.1 phosphopantetheine-binding protein [Caldisericia bacterium]HON83606.1 phosphopantetheine-binding protein [Caldisericia bacterium]HPC56709.1 phosphopantetheine-binding protein [Caldisericia bacterium]HPP43658.1 phosphopantetheine-binding protein [Caldisericia bacterium]
MEREKIKDKIVDILINGVHVKKSKVFSKENPKFIDDLEMDSLSILDLIERVEKEFNIEVKDEEIEKLSDLDSVIDYLYNKKRSP